MATPKLTETNLRIFMMDRKELNTLLRGVRWDTKDIDEAINMCVSYYNGTPPFVDYQTSTTFPYTWLLLTGVSAHLLKSASINEASNQLNYSADGVSVQDKDKAEIFSRIGGAMWDEFKSKVQDIKISVNVSLAFGSSPSELSYMIR